MNTTLIKATSFTLFFFMGIIFVSAQELELKPDGYYRNGFLFTGTHMTYHDNGKPESERHFSDGLEHGISNYYDSTGVLIEVRAWNLGRKHGTWITYGPSGQKTGEANYANDLKHGKWYIWDENGVLRYEMDYINGKKAGSWFMWNEKGELIDEKKH